MKIANEEEYQGAVMELNDLDRYISKQAKYGWENWTHTYRRGRIREAMYNYEQGELNENNQ